MTTFNRTVRKPPIRKKADGFDSDVERTFHGALSRVGIKFEFQVPEPLSPPSVHKTQKTVLLKDRGADEINIIVDFEFEKDGIKYYVDTKGAKEAVKQLSRTKYILLKHRLILEGKQDQTQVKFIYYKDILTLAKLASDKTQFWKFFHQIKAF